MSKRRKFSEEFKREAVGLTLQPVANFPTTIALMPPVGARSTAARDRRGLRTARLGSTPGDVGTPLADVVPCSWRGFGRSSTRAGPFSDTRSI